MTFQCFTQLSFIFVGVCWYCRPIFRRISDRSSWLSTLIMRWATLSPFPVRAILSRSRNWCASSKKPSGSNRKPVIPKPLSSPDAVARERHMPQCSSYGSCLTWPAAGPKRTPLSTLPPLLPSSDRWAAPRRRPIQNPAAS